VQSNGEAYLSRQPEVYWLQSTYYGVEC